MDAVAPPPTTCWRSVTVPRDGLEMASSTYCTICDLGLKWVSLPGGASRGARAGQRVAPGISRGRAAGRGWNADHDRRPAVIAPCTSTADVVREVRAQ
jgi:hypothetical protein